MTEPNAPPSRSMAHQTIGESPVVFTSEQLFGGRTEILLLHKGMPYRLRITRQDKLILTK